MEQPKFRHDQTAANPTRDRGLDLKDKQIVLMLQGGGALGAYQVGVFKALASECAKAQNKIEWVAGISIGAINAAVIAAPKNGDSVAELELLWEEILSPNYPPYDYTSLMKAWLPYPRQDRLATLESKYADWTWLAFNPDGQQNFFSSRVLNPFHNPWVQQWFRKLDRNELAFYGTQPLTETLNRHVNWEALDDPYNFRLSPHLSLGATHVCDGDVEFFNSWEMPLNADHVRASAALPPAFPPIQIGEEWYFDGGISSNTPIEALAGKLFDSKKDTLVLLVDLWDRKNDVLPESLDDVLWRQKCIEFGSRKKAAEIVVERYKYKCMVEMAKGKQPVRLELCQLMLEQNDQEPQFCFADADFSRSTFQKLYAQGFEDMIKAFHHAEKVKLQEDNSPADPYAILYRHGSQGKWKTPRTGHQHQASSRNDLPTMFKPWTAWWKQFA
jgi:predicted acylesterase/phospholipase RssA